MTELKPGWQLVKFGEVVRLNKENCKDPEAAGIKRVIGLEHLEPGDLRVRSWADVADGTTFTNRVRPGQVLFGKRRAYQRKVAVADFDAVCSGDIYVLESADPERLLPDLLPFICQTDAFFEHAVETSAGSLSPRTSWKSLVNYEFALPPLEAQLMLAQVLIRAREMTSSLSAVAQASRRLHRSYIDSVLANGVGQSRFSPGHPRLSPGWTYQPIESLCSDIVDCLHRTPVYSEQGYPAIRTSDIEPGILKWETANRVSESEYKIQVARLVPQHGDILFSREGERMGMAAIVPEGVAICICQRMMHLRAIEGFPPGLIAEFLNSSWVQSQIAMHTSGSTAPHVNVGDVRSFMVPVPPRDFWNEFAYRSKALLDVVALSQLKANQALQFLSKLSAKLLGEAGFDVH